MRDCEDCGTAGLRGLRDCEDSTFATHRAPRERRHLNSPARERGGTGNRSSRASRVSGGIWSHTSSANGAAVTDLDSSIRELPHARYLKSRNPSARAASAWGPPASRALLRSRGAASPGRLACRAGIRGETVRTNYAAASQPPRPREAAAGRQWRFHVVRALRRSDRSSGYRSVRPAPAEQPRLRHRRTVVLPREPTRESGG